MVMMIIYHLEKILSTRSNYYYISITTIIIILCNIFITYYKYNKIFNIFYFILFHFKNKIIYRIDIPDECKIELKKEGYDFFRNLFNKYDKVINK